VVRAALESLAVSLSDGVVAPLLAYLCAGLPGLLLYKTVNTADSMIGHMTLRHRAFGWAAARFDDLLNLAPARLSALLIAAAACFIPGCHPWEAVKTALRDARKHKSPNAGWPEAALAGALDVALLGPRQYGGILVQSPWFGAGRAQATTHDLRRGLMLYVIAGVLQLGLLGGIGLLAAR
jgi:adenosylcobinamide-phosphate synthase